ncbi:putative haloacid dehalogenase-like hydrolase [Aspergillus novofumigatus IBT 16806]|uniref:Putative haloacid dehalogenase-like hydrolase n=1 Tax=Aspergillus novofumigatus (strain IBT 16806) TaxID=1392255 RepID=A0A2I1CLY4_ASPN1|nr:putative haloacid dehalogenase-like hydrolase [Aspergillus novofumigatus IBT 16806]PKX98638.1 putative haloacid dehalogenase-like hydrolase [Aspergillus novofumigatus IBT 16806]
MDVTQCGLGPHSPEFHLPSDIDGVRQDLFTKGIAFVEECDETSIVHLGNQLGEIVRPRNEKAHGSGISHIRFAPNLTGKGYSSEELFFHTDRSGWDEPPRILMSTLKSRSEAGGESLLADGYQVLGALKQEDEKLYDLITNSKHTSFRSDDEVFVPRAIFDREKGILRFRFDDSIQLSASMVSRFSRLQDIIYENAFVVSLQPGQGYILDNHRYLHGRASFSGSRELLRVLVKPHAPRRETVVLFDIDGTLCRSEELSIDAYFSCVSAVVGKTITHANTPVNLHGQTDLSLLRAILDYHGVDDKSLLTEKFFQLHPQYLEDSNARGLQAAPCPGAKEMLVWLTEDRNKHCYPPIIHIGLLTGNSRPNALLKLRAAGIDTSIFDLEISSFGDVHSDRHTLFQDSFAKLQACYGLGISAHDIIIVGDTPLDVECAKQSGCSVIAVATGSYKVDDLALLQPDFCCSQLPEAKDFLALMFIHSSQRGGGRD